MPPVCVSVPVVYSYWFDPQPGSDVCLLIGETLGCTSSELPSPLQCQDGFQRYLTMGFLVILQG